MGPAGKHIVIIIALLMLASPLMGMAGGSGDVTDDDRDGSRGSWTVRRFIEHRTPVSVNFETSTENASYHLSVPNTATVTSASITLQGVERYSLKGTPNDFDDPVGHSHMAYYGQIGVFPPKASPSTYENIRIDPRDEDAFKFLDGTAFETSTPNGANPPNYPYQHFDLKIDKTGMVRLQVSWDGWGYCVGNDTNTHGAEMFLWNYSGLEWFRFGRYAANDTLGSPRGFSHTLMEPYDFTDGFGHVNILVFGQHDEPQGGGWTDVGSVATDHVTVTVLRNDTLQRPHGPSLAMGDADPFWSAGGDFTGTVTLAAGSGFQAALQAYVNSIAPWPAPLEVPFRFEVDRSTWGLIKVTDLAVTIREVDNQPPRFLSAREVATEEDVDLVKAIDLKDHFDDDHNGPDLTYTVEYEQNASAVRAVIHTDGHHVNFLSVAKDWAGSLNFKFNATDVWGLTTISTNFTLMVEEVNDPPLLVDPGDLFIDEDLPFEFNISCIDPDLPYGDILSFEDDSPMFDIDPATGRIAFTPDQDDVGRHNVTVVVRDIDGRWDEVTFAIIVADVNDPPLISDPGVLVAYEDGRFDYNFTAVDEDGNDGFYWVLVGGVGTMKLGQYNGRLTWIPSGEFVGITNVSIIVTDRKGAADQVNVSIEVININDVPILDELRPAHLIEGRPFSYTIGFSDPDREEDPEEEHTFTLEPDLFPILPGGVIDFVPTNDHVGTYLLLVTITDAAGTTDEMEWELRVANVNERPTIEHVEDQSWREDQRVTMFINASDSDKGDVLTFTDSTSIFEIDSRTGEIDFTPAQMNVGAHTLRIVVTDSEGLYVDIYFEVTILPFNDAPTVSIRVVTIVDRLREGDQLSLAADVEDEDDEMHDLSFFWFLDGKEVGIEASLVLDDLAPGDHTVELAVEDGDNRVSATYQFTVEDVEEPFSWLWIIVVLVIVVVVAVLGLKVFRAVQDTETGPRGEGRDGQKEPEKPEVDHQDGAFDNWSGR